MKLSKQNSFLALGIVIGVVTVFSLGAYTASFTKQTLELLPGNTAVEKGVMDDMNSGKQQPDAVGPALGRQP